jgi:hypothetical protein
LFVNNFHSTETFQVEIIIPELACELMGHYKLNWEIKHVFTPPTIEYKTYEILDKILVGIPPNSTLIFKAI